MSRMLARPIAAAALALALGLPGSGIMAAADQETGATDKGQPYDAEFVLDNVLYTGTMTLKIAGTTVSGSMAIAQPIPVTGEVAGSLKGEALVLEYPFSAGGEQPCNGIAKVTGKMSENRASASGSVEVFGCSEVPMQGTFTLKRKEAGKRP